MKRLTSRDEYGNADIIGVDSSKLLFNLYYDEFCRVTEALNRLADYEDRREPRPPENKVHPNHPGLGRGHYCTRCSAFFPYWDDENGRTNFCGNCGQRLRDVVQG